MSLELILKNHSQIASFCQPVYHLDPYLMDSGAKLLNLQVPKDINLQSLDSKFTINPGVISAESGDYSFNSFVSATSSAVNNGEALVNLPVSKLAWQRAGHNFKGHTDYFRKKLNQEPIMMLGGPRHYCILYTDHIAIKDVPGEVIFEKLVVFFNRVIKILAVKKIYVLGLNPHCGEDGIIGHEDEQIKKAINFVNEKNQPTVLSGPHPADSHFANLGREDSYTIAMYHDQGLVGIKTLAFFQAFQISLGMTLKRSSVDHGPAFDIAYKNNQNSLLSANSYINAVSYAANMPI